MMFIGENPHVIIRQMKVIKQAKVQFESLMVEQQLCFVPAWPNDELSFVIKQHYLLQIMDSSE